MKKELIGIFICVLFFSVSLSRAISVDTKQIINNESDECSECKELSNAEIFKVRQLINKIEVYRELLLIYSKQNPELIEISEGFINQVSTLYELFDDRIICSIFEQFYLLCLSSAAPWLKLIVACYETGNYFLVALFGGIALIFTRCWWDFCKLYLECSCEENDFCKPELIE
jgi:hypothetical protein